MRRLARTRVSENRSACYNRDGRAENDMAEELGDEIDEAAAARAWARVKGKPLPPSRDGDSDANTGTSTKGRKPSFVRRPAVTKKLLTK